MPRRLATFCLAATLWMTPSTPSGGAPAVAAADTNTPHEGSSSSSSSSSCVEQAWCKTAPSTKPQPDGSENPNCERWVKDCPCTCAKAVVVAAEKERQAQLDAAEQEAFEATWTHLAGGGKKYFLYDVKPGEGFNLQKEIFVRAVTTVSLLNDGRTSEDAEWVLVLPPWCRLAHWNFGSGRGSKPRREPWGTFFDTEVMQTGDIDIIEYDTYREQFGDNVELSLFSDSANAGNRWRPGEERKRVTEIDCHEIANAGRNPDHWLPHNDTHLKSGYSGNCNDIFVERVGCFQGGPPTITSLPPLIGQQAPAVPRSVLMRRFDRYSGPHNWRYHAARKLLAPSQGVVEGGEAFIRDNLPRPYLAAHVRRGDFPHYARKKTTPSLDVAAGTLRIQAEKMGAKAIFVCTDGSAEEKETLRQNLAPFAIHFLDEDLGHPGVNAITEQWIAARANRFIGTAESRYTLQIMEERDLMGVPEELTWRHFHKSNPNELVSKENWFKSSFSTDKARLAKWGEFWTEGTTSSTAKSEL